MIQQIQNSGIPVVAISLRKDAAGQQNKMNPTMADEEQVYNEGLKQGIRLIADVVGRKPQAETLIDYVLRRGQNSMRRSQNPGCAKVRIYMANPDLMTYGSGKYTGLMMQHAGGLNVAAASVKAPVRLRWNRYWRGTRR